MADITELTVPGNRRSVLVTLDAIGAPVEFGSYLEGGDGNTDLATSTTTARQAVTTGKVAVRFQNLGATAGDIIRVQFGNSAVIATAGESAALMPGDTKTLKIPSGDTHFAYISEANTPTLAWDEV